LEDLLGSSLYSVWVKGIVAADFAGPFFWPAWIGLAEKRNTSTSFTIFLLLLRFLTAILVLKRLTPKHLGDSWNLRYGLTDVGSGDESTTCSGRGRFFQIEIANSSNNHKLGNPISETPFW